MDKRIELYWVDKYPNLFAGYRMGIYKSPMAWGFTCGEGWFELLDQLWKDLSEIDGVVMAQVKEKFGGLRAYLASAGSDPIMHDQVHKLINDAETKSFETCEVCGEAGTRRGNGWIFTACDGCSPLDRDGRWAVTEQLASKIIEKLNKEKDVP